MQLLPFLYYASCLPLEEAVQMFCCEYVVLFPAVALKAHAYCLFKTPHRPNCGD